MAESTTFAQGDSLENLMRKFLTRLNSSPLAPMSAATQFRPGDTRFVISRKINARLNEMKPTATGDVKYAQGDSEWSLWRKSLEILNQMTMS